MYRKIYRSDIQCVFRSGDAARVAIDERGVQPQNRAMQSIWVLLAARLAYVDIMVVCIAALRTACSKPLKSPHWNVRAGKTCSDTAF